MHAWKEYLARLETELGRDVVEKWLRPLRIAHFDACNLYLQASDSFQVTWFNEHIKDRVKNELFNNNKKTIRVHLASIDETESSKKEKKSKKEEEPARFQLHFEELDPNCAFNQFLVPEGSLLAHKILCEVAGYQLEEQATQHDETQQAMFNPIYLYGASGAGKTHLLMATTQELRKKGVNALYVRGETFIDHVVKAIREGQMPLFRQIYRQSDVLLIDDVHIFSRKGSTQEELFHTFNTLHLDGKQIILSSNCAPQELQHVEPRLVSRFEWGIVLPLETLTHNKWEDLLKQRAQLLKFPLTKVTKEFLLETFKSSPNALIKALNALVLRSHIRNHTLEHEDDQKLTIPKMQEWLSDLIRHEKELELTPKSIIHAVAQQYGILSEELLGKSQSKECVTPRKVAMYLCRQKLNLPFTKIGDIFERDHSTAMASVKQVEHELTLTLSEMAGQVNTINKKLSLS